MIKINLMKGDCLEKMKEIPDKSVDLVLTDPPYGTTACKWDSVVPFDLMWKELKRIIKDKGAIALFGSEPFSSALRMSNIKEFKYDWTWDKKSVSNPMMAKRQPLRNIEIVSIFYSKQPSYIPQMSKGIAWKRAGKKEHSTDTLGASKLFNNGSDKTDLKYPKSLIQFSNADKTNNQHPTQKPVPLLEYLIKTYTLEGETVLDFTMGSGSCGVACLKTGRNFIGIERDDKYFEIAKNRIEAVQ